MRKCWLMWGRGCFKDSEDKEEYGIIRYVERAAEKKSSFSKFYEEPLQTIFRKLTAI